MEKENNVASMFSFINFGFGCIGMYHVVVCMLEVYHK